MTDLATLETRIDELLLHVHRLVSALEAGAERYRDRQRLLCRPSLILEPDISEAIDGCTGEVIYTAEYRGLFAHGPTPDEAYEEFDKLWMGRE